MECELCGREVENLKKVKIESTVLEVCDSCAKAGKTVKTKKSSKNKSKKSKKNKKPDKYLVADFGELIKGKREEKDLKIEDLASQINEKASVVRRLEQGKLKPDENLAKKLNKNLGIELYREGKKQSYQTTKKSKSEKELTMGDVAEVKEE